MWYLLVAAGAGYLAQRWQNAHKAQPPLISGCGQNQTPSPPSSAPATPKRRSFSLSSKNMPSDSTVLHNVNTGFRDLTDKKGGLTDREIASSIAGNAESSTDDQYVSKLPVGSPQDNSSSLQVVKSNKRSACEAFLVPVIDAFKPIQGNTKDQFVSNSRPSLDFANRDSKEQLQEDSTSHSSCCSTVINSPIGSQSILQKFEFFQFQGNEQNQEINVCEQLSTLQNNVAGNCFESSPHFVENGASKTSGQVVGFSMSHYPHAETKYPEALQHTSPCRCEEGLSNSAVVEPGSSINALTSSNGSLVTNDNMMSDASTYRLDMFTGDNQRSNTRTSFVSYDFMCSEKSKFEGKQGTLEMATDVNRKARPLLSPSHRAATETLCDADSESLISFGLAMAVFFMVSSSKREMEKMGKVLKETEDLVSDMRKELDERKAQPCFPSLSLGVEEGNGELFTIKTKNEVAQVYTTGKTDNHTDSFYEDDLSDDESTGSVVTEEHVQDRLHMCDLEAELEAGLQFMNTNLEGSDSQAKQVSCSNGGKHNEDCDSDDEMDSTTLEEAGENDYVVSMIELERKLWKIFQQRQEEKILELEESLEVALSKLHAKEEELRWWKNRASWLMEHSFGSTSGRTVLGEVSTKDRVDIVGGVDHTDKSINSMKECDAGEKITHQFLADQTSFLAVERCIEFVGNEDCLQNSSGHQNQMVRIGSACSISSEESVLSLDVETFTYPEDNRSIQLS